MKRAGNYIWIVLVLMIAGSSCKKPFAPHLNTVTTNFLAIDGPIISGDSTFISLSRTTSLSDTTQNKAELKAVVSVEDDQNKLYPLNEKGKGLYVLGVTTFNIARKYRLDIKTNDGKVYQSDFVPLKVTPAIDSIYFHQNSEATVLFYVNAHDGTNSTRYYRWDYKETWSYVALFKQIFQYKGGNVVPVVPDSPDDLTTCYRSAPSNQVFVGSSAKLAGDVISAQQLGGLANGSEKLGHIYTMQLKQYALTQDGYNYYLNLKTNTEQLGSIFDAQPSLAKGNIHCITSPNDVVIGFLSASTVATKQFNLHANDIQLRAPDPYGLDEWLHTGTAHRVYNAYYFAPPDTNSCHPAAISTAPYATFALRASKTFAKGDSLLFEGVPFIQNDAPGGVGYLYYYAPKNCVDCRLKGGTNIRPSYFPAF
jgi:hypothetical protein